MKRCKKIYFLIVSIIFISLFTTISSQRTNHFAKETILSIGGNQFNLENAFRNGKFNGDYSLTNVVSSELDIFGHQNDEIYLNVNGTFKNLKSAIEDGSLRCTPAGKSPADYESIIHGEYAKNIWVEYYKMDLQTAINQGKFYAGDGYCNKKNEPEATEPEVNEYYVCSPCLSPNGALDLRMYFVAKYSTKSNKETPNKIEECYQYCSPGGSGAIFEHSSYAYYKMRDCQEKNMRCLMQINKYVWSNIPSPIEGFHYDSKTNEYFEKNSNCKSARAIDSRCN